MKLFVCLILLNNLCLTDRTPPQWANKFTQKISEKIKYTVFSKSVETTIYYDWDSKRYRIDRNNGSFDRYCGTVKKFSSTPCSHYVVEGKRYLHFPKKEDCCFCCDAEHGCGVLKPNWLENATFVKEFT